MHPTHITSVSLLVVGVTGIVAAIPLLLGKVPRNGFYGFRTKLTRSSDEIWYPANRVAAKALLAWGILNLAVAIPSFWLHPCRRRRSTFCTSPLRASHSSASAS